MFSLDNPSNLWSNTDQLSSSSISNNDLCQQVSITNQNSHMNITQQAKKLQILGNELFSIFLIEIFKMSLESMMERYPNR